MCIGTMERIVLALVQGIGEKRNRYGSLTPTKLFGQLSPILKDIFLIRYRSCGRSKGGKLLDETLHEAYIGYVSPLGDSQLLVIRLNDEYSRYKERNDGADMVSLHGMNQICPVWFFVFKLSFTVQVTNHNP